MHLTCGCEWNVFNHHPSPLHWITHYPKQATANILKTLLLEGTYQFYQYHISKVYIKSKKVTLNSPYKGYGPQLVSQQPVTTSFSKQPLTPPFFIEIRFVSTLRNIINKQTDQNISTCIWIENQILSETCSTETGIYSKQWCISYTQLPVCRSNYETVLAHVLRRDSCQWKQHNPAALCLTSYTTLEVVK